MSRRKNHLASFGRSAAVALAIAVSGVASHVAADARAGQHTMSVVGTRFEVTTDDGRVIPQTDLVGTVLTIGDGSGQLELRIDAVESDPKNPDGAVMLYTMSSPDPVTGEWHNICEPDIEGRRMGFPLAGTWTPDGRHLPSAMAFSITCTGGAQAKCVRFGYLPWEKLPDGTSLWDHHQACTRMIRADYCGDGEPHTRNGTPIVVYDRKGIQDDEQVSGMLFEAAWGPDGAICVSHTRIPDVLSMERLAAICPGVDHRPLAENCEGDPDALILNRSIHAQSAQAAAE